MSNVRAVFVKQQIIMGVYGICADLANSLFVHLTQTSICRQNDDTKQILPPTRSINSPETMSEDLRFRSQSLVDASLPSLSTRYYVLIFS